MLAAAFIKLCSIEILVLKLFLSGIKTRNSGIVFEKTTVSQKVEKTSLSDLHFNFAALGFIGLLQSFPNLVKLSLGFLGVTYLL